MNCRVRKTGRLSSDIASEIHDSPNHPTEGILCRSSSLIFDRCWLVMSGMHRDAPGGFRISQSAVGKCHNCCWEPCPGRRGKVKLEGWKLVHKIGATLICPHAANNQYPLIDKIKVHSKDIQAVNSRWIPGDTGYLEDGQFDWTMLNPFGGVKSLNSANLVSTTRWLGACSSATAVWFCTVWSALVPHPKSKNWSL